MTESLHISPRADAIFGFGRQFDPKALAWGGVAELPDDAYPVDPATAMKWLLSKNGQRRIPIGVIGPSNASEDEYAAALELGHRLGELGFVVVCGGRSGAMEAVAKGCSERGGLTIGVLPEGDWSAANDYITVPLATGVGEARNAIIACASKVLIAVGGGYGTLSEMAFGLRLGRPVLALPGAHRIDGAVACSGVDDAVDALIRHVLRLV